MLIRRETTRDAPAVASVHASAFQVEEGAEEPVEVALVDRLRRSTAWISKLSLVAVVAEEIVGHVLCSRALIDPYGHPVLALGPIGVTTSRQRQGIGSALMHSVLGAADACDESLVGLLGEPAYYCRFGFVPAKPLHIEAPNTDWGEYFQIRPLSSFHQGLHGRFRYAPPFEL